VENGEIQVRGRQGRYNRQRPAARRRKSAMLRSLLVICVVLGAAALPGCLHPDQDQAARAVAQQLANLPRDRATHEAVGTPQMRLAPEPPPVKGPPEPFKLPKDLPGANAPPLVMPNLDQLKTKEEKDAAIKKAFPQVPETGADPVPQPGPDGKPLDLPALQAMALATNPTIRQAAEDIAGARGGALQAGLYPNPTVGYEGDQMNSSKTSGQQGGFVEQLIKTPGKLSLARSAAEVDVRNAELAMRKSQLDLMTQVRTYYFAVLVAQENMVVSRALMSLADEVYQLQLKQLRGDQAAAYEPLQLHVFAMQAHGNVVQARNRYLAAWRQLATALGKADMPPTELAGGADRAVPLYPFDDVRAHMLECHTDVATAKNTILKQEYILRLQRLTPYPDLTTHVAIQKDTTGDPHTVQVSVQMGIAIPVWDRNQGNILQAQAQLAHANEDVARVELDLNQRLAEAYERYRDNVTLTTYYRDSILPNQVRVYRGIYKKYLGAAVAGQVQFNDVVVAQQTLSQALQTYLQSLQAQWQAVVDVGALLQTDDLYDLSAPRGVCPGGTGGPCATVPLSRLLDFHTWAEPQDAPPVKGPALTAAPLASSPAIPNTGTLPAALQPGATLPAVAPTAAGAAPRAVLAQPVALPN
jgi:cobalt-zinc-cadmium efflux system outer membrane protein